MTMSGTNLKTLPTLPLRVGVPQRAILSSPKLKFALIHGGLATIKECVYFNKPFLIFYPWAKIRWITRFACAKYPSEELHVSRGDILTKCAEVI